MNDKDKKAFIFWIDHYPSDRLDSLGLHELMKSSWQAALEYKDKEIMNEVRQTPSGVSVVKFNKELVRKEIEKLQAENKKLCEALELIYFKICTQKINDSLVNHFELIAKEALKEVGEE